MTHPLTPREKVARIVDPWAFSIIANITQTERAADNRAKALTKADAIIEAIAPSGDQLSGNPGILKSDDHAELARLADMADWMADGDPGANGSVLLSASVASEHASDLKVLLAENAALRAENTEAERKLAEADKCARSIVAMEIPPGDDPEQRMKLLSMLARAQVLARTFLSKEAERG